MTNSTLVLHEIYNKYVHRGMLCTDEAELNRDLRQETIEIDKKMSNVCDITLIVKIVLLTIQLNFKSKIFRF